ncbi:putative cholinesterase precursor [Triangularia verruculosa]|uniref:Carboxylic ester hydrolase n=1 Tax=Triangularia verruculosa TaxID=2587418 RepID=A0AAN7AQY3_9PEZI|nr:putative cholinesterase precursor [Triangularia verruculosa]
MGAILVLVGFVAFLWNPFGVHAAGPLVSATTGDHVGKALSCGVSQWLGIRYAAPPLGELRFQPPVDPLPATGPHYAYEHGPICLATGTLPMEKTMANFSEDCLFLDVYAPSNAHRQSKLPVFVYIQGGGFNSNSHPRLNGTGLVKASDMGIVVVTFNYRVGPFGFLVDNHKLTANNGLRDQRQALKWVQKNIAQFGGDPGHVVLGGASAGASSIAWHLTAYRGYDQGLFHAAVGESAAWGHVLTTKQARYQFDDLVVRIGCVRNSSEATLTCLRNKPYGEIQMHGFGTPYPGQSLGPLFMWGPVIDYDMFYLPLIEAFGQGKFLKVPVMWGDDTNGGSIFISPFTSTVAHSNRWMRSQYPYLTIRKLSLLNNAWKNTIKEQARCPARDCWREQLRQVFGDMRYMCPSIYMSATFPDHGFNKSWNYRWNVEDPDQITAGVGVPHITEISALFGPEFVPAPYIRVPKTYRQGEINEKAVHVMQKYWISFIRKYDPNTERAEGSAQWEKLDKKKLRRLRFDTGGLTEMEYVGSELARRCALLFNKVYPRKIGTAMTEPRGMEE